MLKLFLLFLQSSNIALIPVVGPFILYFMNDILSALLVTNCILPDAMKFIC
jgi:hypothetical protein